MMSEPLLVIPRDAFTILFGVLWFCYVWAGLFLYARLIREAFVPTSLFSGV